VADLEVVTGAQDRAAARIFQTVEHLGMSSRRPYLFRAGDRLIASVSVTERDGSPITSPRAAELLGTLRSVLSGRGILAQTRRPDPRQYELSPAA
jgi:hypothetical protein